MSCSPGIRLLAAAAVSVLALSGCRDPYASQHASAPTRAATTTQPSAAPAPALTPTARVVARAFAAGWITWDWRSAAAQQRRLATLATGDLARQLIANAASARIDASLARDRPGSRGAVVAVELHTGARTATGLVVTREQATTDGRDDLAGQRYRVYLIELVRDGAWEVSTWKPQP